MNYLAHIYLSGDNELVTIGNFMADGIKGKTYKNFPDEIQKGILLHRAIDSFTDSHHIVKQSTRRLHNRYSHYSGVIVDIFYDHFLAKNWHRYCDYHLDAYVQDFYAMLTQNVHLLTPRIKKMMPFLIQDNWLLSYADLDGIATVLRNMNKRTGGKSGMNRAIIDLEKYYTDFEREFFLFFKELELYCKERRIDINAQF